MGFVANFTCFPAVQKFRKSVKIWQSYREFKSGNFFWDTVYKQSGYLWQDVLHTLYIDVLAMENRVCQLGMSVPVLDNAESNVAIC